MENKFIGTWIIDPTDKKSVKLYGNTKMIFDDKFNLAYEIDESNKIQIIKLTYEYDDTVLITDQPSSPKKVETKYKFENNGDLILEINNIKSRYKKIK
jgi:hypothetical protein